MRNVESRMVEEGYVYGRPGLGQWVCDGGLAALGVGLLLIAKLNAESGYENIAATHAYTSMGLLITALLGSIKLSLDWRRALNEQS